MYVQRCCDLEAFCIAESGRHCVPTENCKAVTSQRVELRLATRQEHCGTYRAVLLAFRTDQHVSETSGPQQNFAANIAHWTKRCGSFQISPLHFEHYPRQISGLREISEVDPLQLGITGSHCTPRWQSAEKIQSAPPRHRIPPAEQLGMAQRKASQQSGAHCRPC